MDRHMTAMSAAADAPIRLWNVLVVGGAGYVGSRLVPKLLDAGHKVTVLDLYLYGEQVFGPHGRHAGLRQVKGDMRHPAAVADALSGIDAVIHLACISNDPSFDLDPELGKSINYDSFRPLVRAARDAGVRRFVYASSSSVYGIKDEENVTEDLALSPLTDYSKYKAMCEDVLLQERAPGFAALILRPATVCGYARRLRLDLAVNILTAHAVENGVIKVFGGAQKRPNINIEDMTDLYVAALQYEDEAIDGEIFNAGYENYPVMSLAEMVKDAIGPKVRIEVSPTNDLRSYHISSDKIARRLGFRPRHTIGDAVSSIRTALTDGTVTNPLKNPIYYNIERMKQVALS
jgi:nucleoside-diphosphate-sugar epimerase